MSTIKINIIGLKYGKLTVINEIKERNKNGHIMYNVLCDCGISKKILGSSLRCGSTRSCGCLITEKNSTHRKSHEKIYRKWQQIKQRCYNEKNNRYKNYGGRGIKMCESWLNSFENFINDMGYPENEKLSIDRINVNGDYEKNNCKWSNDKEQANNRTNNVKFLIYDEYLTLSEICRKYKKPISTVNNRLKRGLNIYQAIS